MDLTTKDILEVITHCRERGVTCFEGFGLKLSFGENSTPPVYIAPEDAKATDEAAQELEIRIKADQLEELKISDPYVYEQLIAFDQAEG